MIARLKKINAKSYSFSFLGNLFSSASQWVVLMLISKLYGTTQMGYYTLALAWILPLYAFFSLQIRNIHVADQANLYGFNVFFQIRIAGAVILFIICSLIGLLFYPHIYLVFIMAGLYKAIEMMSDMIHAEFHKRKQIEVYSKMLMFRSVLAISLNLVLFHFIRSFQLALISLPLAYLCSLLIDLRLLGNIPVKISLRPDHKKIGKFIITGLLTGLSLLLVYLLPGIPRFILEKFSNGFNLGLFSGYLSLVVFSRIFVQSVVQNSLPYLAQSYDEQLYGRFIATLKKDALIVAVLGLAQFLLIPVSNYVFPLLYNKDFSGNEVLLSIIFAGSLFSFIAFVLNNGINAMKLFRLQLPVYGTLVIISFLLGFLLIPRYGLNGAAIAFSIVNFCTCAILFSVLFTKLHGKVKKVATANQQIIYAE